MSRDPLTLDAIDAAWADEKAPGNVQSTLFAARDAIAGKSLDGLAMAQAAQRLQLPLTAFDRRAGLFGARYKLRAEVAVAWTQRRNLPPTRLPDRGGAGRK